MENTKKAFAFVLVFCLLLSLCGCSSRYEYVGNAVGSFAVGYSERANRAFLADYHWDGDEDGMSIATPANYNGAAITALGGYTGRGVPSPFRILPTEDAKAKLCPKATAWYYASHTASEARAEVQYLRFKLHIGASIKELDHLSMGGIVLAGYEENGEERSHVYVITCSVDCAAENETFYAKDGKLYYRQGDALVEGIVYDDFDIAAHNERNRDEARVLSPF